MKKAACLILMFVLLITLSFSAAAESTSAPAVWSGNSDISWYEESREEFTLTSAEQLAGLAQLVNSGTSFEGKTVFLGCDIRLNSGNFDENGVYDGERSEIKDWTPIGRKNSYFKGTFDGNGHTVSGIHIFTMDEYTGFFGYSTGEIRNVSVVSGSVRGGDRTAAVCGYNRNGIVEGCYSDCFVYSSWWGGGITGVTSGMGRVSRCANNGSIRANISAGGICGMLTETHAVIEDCFNSGRIYGGLYGGGICGMNELAKINTCVNVGEIFSDEPYPVAKKYTHFDSGKHTQITNCRCLAGQELMEDGSTALTPQQMCDRFSVNFSGFDEEIWQAGASDISESVPAPEGMYVAGQYPKINGVGEPVYFYADGNPQTGTSGTAVLTVAAASAAICAVSFRKKR